MYDLQIFKNDEFGEIRVFEREGITWFAGKDVADILGYTNQSKAVQQHVDEDDRIKEQIATSQNGRLVSNTWFINESGLYSLILSSKLPTAKKFKRWVTSEVLPAIRKNGCYALPQVEVLEDEPQTLDLTQLELDQRIKIASIIASCRRERLALVAKVLSLDINELRPQSPLKPDDTEMTRSFINSVWDNYDRDIPFFVIYGEYNKWCRANNMRPLTKNAFSRVMTGYYPVQVVNMSYVSLKRAGLTNVKNGHGYRKLSTTLSGCEEGGVLA